MVQGLHKNWLLVSKITLEIWTTLEKEWKVQKVEIRWATFVQKYISSVKTLYTEDLSNNTFNHVCENLPNSLYHFWNHKLFSSNITYFLQNQPIKKQIFRLSTARVKIHQIPHVIPKTKSQFFFKVWITFQCHEK